MKVFVGWNKIRVDQEKNQRQKRSKGEEIKKRIDNHQNNNPNTLLSFLRIEHGEEWLHYVFVERQFI